MTNQSAIKLTTKRCNRLMPYGYGPHFGPQFLQFAVCQLALLVSRNVLPYSDLATQFWSRCHSENISPPLARGSNELSLAPVDACSPCSANVVRSGPDRADAPRAQPFAV